MADVAASRSQARSQSSSPKRPPSLSNSASSRSQTTVRPFELSSESTPLLLRRDDILYGTQPYSRRSSSSSSSRDSPSGRSSKKSDTRLRWPIYASFLSLSISVLGILLFVFAAPAVVKRYAEEAAVFTPRDLSIDSITPHGLRARVQGDFVLNSTRVPGKQARNFGRFTTWVIREVETAPSDVLVYLPEYGNVLVGTASLPVMKLNVRDGLATHVDFLTDLATGDIRGMRSVAMDWLEGRLGRLRLKGSTRMHLKSGLLGLGTHTLSESVTFGEKDFPSFPELNVTKANVHDQELSARTNTMVVDVSIAALFNSPFTFTIPPLEFEVLVPNCSPVDPYILVANTTTGEVQVHSRSTTFVDASGLVKNLPNELTSACPGQDASPLDLLVKDYIQNLRATIYVRGANSSSSHTPAWITEILRSVTVPLPLTGHSLDNAVKNLTMSDVKLSLPDPLAEPDSPEAQPKMSAMVKTLIKLPEQMNFQVDVPHVRAKADVSYLGEKLGFFSLPEWLPSNSTLSKDVDNSPALLVEFFVKDAPLHVTDENVLTEVIQAYLFGRKPVQLHIAAAVDVEVSTRLGSFALREIPAQGSINLNPPPGGSIDQLNPQIESLELGPTTEASVLVKTKVNLTNPTPYSATLPMVDFILLYNGTAVGHVLTQHVFITPGLNTGVHVDMIWNPSQSNGTSGVYAGRQLMSRYASGLNTSVSIRTHRGTIPALPELGQAMSKLEVNLPVPRLSTPGSPDNENDGQSPFIQDATLHLWSSTAEFILYSPLPRATILVTSIDAKAFYAKKEPIGIIDYGHPIKLPPGRSQTPRLPVILDPNGIGFDAVKRALGRSLKMDAVARVGVRIGDYSDVVTYRGKGISANVRV